MQPVGALVSTLAAIPSRITPPTGNHNRLSRLNNSLDRLLYKKGTYAAALWTLTRATELSQRILEEHSATVESLNCLGDLKEAIAEFKPGNALALFERALDISERVLGPEHRHTAWSLHNTAFSLLPLGQHARAAAPQASTGNPEKVFGSNHPHTNLSRLNLAALLFQAGDGAAAEQLLKGALGKIDPNHPLTAMTLQDLASFAEARGDKATAKRLHNQTIAIANKALGSGNPVTRNLKNPKRLFGTSDDWGRRR